MMFRDSSIARWVCILLVLMPSVHTGVLADSGWWKPERRLGSNRLSLKDIGTLYLPAEPSEVLASAVEDLRQIWPVPLQPLERAASPAKQSIILVRGLDRGLFPFGAKPSALADTGAFSLRVERTRVFLRAETDEGLVNGLYAICRDLLGARWYWESDLGFEQVGEVAEKFPSRPWREQPAFIQRTLYPVETNYGRRNRLNRKYVFNHNLARIFSPEVFEVSPEVFATIGGQPQRPRGNLKYDAQPDFTEPKAVALAAQAARTHFEQNPEANSFSLSINDNSLFDEGERTADVVLRRQQTEKGGIPEEGEVEYFRGRPNYTDLVFGFMNQVAKELDSSLANSDPAEPYLSALAYYWTEQSPSFKLHPSVMPVLTSDRAQWHDPVYRAEDKALIRRWAESGAGRIATWDYYYGAPYPYPRQFTQWIGESIPYLEQSGVDVFFSQLPSVWGLDGPKAWLTAELLWDPKQDVQSLLEEFYQNFFGPAASAMRQFYEMAEQTRNAREGAAAWIKFYMDEAGIEMFDPETLQRMRDYLESAMEAAGKSPQTSAEVPESMGSGQLAENRFRDRVKVASDAFAYTETYAAYHRSRRLLLEASMLALSGNSDGVESNALIRALQKYQQAKSTFLKHSRSLAQIGLHGGFKAFDFLKQSEPIALSLAALARSDISLDQLNCAEARACVQSIREWRKGESRLIEIGKNPKLRHTGREQRNFLGPELPVIENWRIQYRPGEGLGLFAADEAEGTGLRVERADIVSVEQTYPVIAEQIYLLRMDARWRVSPDNRSRVQLNWESISGERLRTDIVLRWPTGSSDTSQSLEFVLRAPVNAYDLKLGIVMNRQSPGDFLELESVQLGSFRPINQALEPEPEHLPPVRH